MIMWVFLLIFHCLLGLNGAAGLERIDECGTRCSQGLRCRTEPNYFFGPPCEIPAESLSLSSLFHNISLSTVMRCQGRQECSLHLRTRVAFHPTKHIKGLSICTSSPGMITSCQIIRFKRAASQIKPGVPMEVMNDCAEISPGQRTKVTVKTVPSYCGLTWTSTHTAPDCKSDDLQRHVPDCITGRLSYSVNQERKELNVSVSDMLENHDYHLRMCYKDFFCSSAGAHSLIRKNETVKSATFTYARPLPCLCIEGWSAVTDAPRVQACPFKEHVEELWFGINFDPLEEMLSWTPACRVPAVVTLCQNRDGICVDLPQASRNVSRTKITFSKVDPHPQLCMKFTAGSKSWTKCPFTDARFQALEFTVTRHEGGEDVEMTSRITANFSVGLCVKNDDVITETRNVHAEKHKAVGLKMGDLCNKCLQVKRLDVTYAATIVYCPEACNKLPDSPPASSSQALEDLTPVIMAVAVCLAGIIIVTLVLHILLTVYQKRKINKSGKKAGPPIDCVVPALQTKVLIPDSPSCGNTEKANLISD